MPESGEFEMKKDFFVITAGTIVIGTAVFFFLIPSHLAVASMSGMAIILHSFFPLSVSILTMILNIICLIIGFLFVGKEFGSKTIYTSVLLPLVLYIYERLFPDFQSIMGDAFLDMICYLFLVSIGLTMLFTRNASSGGIDIIAKVLNQFFKIDMGKAISLAGMCISISSIFVYDIKTTLLSILGTYLNGIIVDHFTFGVNEKKKVCIVSKNYTQIRSYIIDHLAQGATLYEAIGGYDFQHHYEIITILNKNAYVKLMNYLDKIDKEAFITVYPVKEVRYKKRNNRDAE